MLQIMSRDTAAALYLGRPCYFGLAGERGCNPQYWTARRFSPEVLASLAEVLRREIARAQVEHVTLLGHSGGATLALLLAEEIPQVDRVITLAGNLDPTAWTSLHGYAPLTGSLNPTQQTAVRDNLIMIHYAGGSDRNIPPALIQAAAPRIGGSVIVVPGFTHTCCWTRIAPEILSVAN
jgi:dienelactone hydrolase